MLIAVRNRFIFVANSKCGSTTVEHVLRDHAEVVRAGSPQRKHIDWCDARDEYGFIFNQPAYAPETFFRFGTLRDPVDWMVSWYNYRRRPKGGDLGPDTSFADFWQRAPALRKRRQIDRFLDFDGVCRFDLLVPVERLDELLEHMLVTLRLPRAEELERANTSPRYLRRQDVDRQLAADIEGHFADDVAAHREGLARFDEGLGPAMKRLEQVSGAAMRGRPRQPVIWRARQDTTAQGG